MLRSRQGNERFYPPDSWGCYPPVERVLVPTGNMLVTTRHSHSTRRNWDGSVTHIDEHSRREEPLYEERIVVAPYRGGWPSPFYSLPVPPRCDVPALPPCESQPYPSVPALPPCETRPSCPVSSKPFDETFEAKINVTFVTDDADVATSFNSVLASRPQSSSLNFLGGGRKANIIIVDPGDGSAPQQVIQYSLKSKAKATFIEHQPIVRDRQLHSKTEYREVEKMPSEKDLQPKTQTKLGVKPEKRVLVVYAKTDAAQQALLATRTAGVYDLLVFAQTGGVRFSTGTFAKTIMVQLDEQATTSSPAATALTPAQIATSLLLRTEIVPIDMVLKKIKDYTYEQLAQPSELVDDNDGVSIASGMSF